MIVWSSCEKNIFDRTVRHAYRNKSLLFSHNRTSSRIIVSSAVKLPAIKLFETVLKTIKHLNVFNKDLSKLQVLRYKGH